MTERSDSQSESHFIIPWQYAYRDLVPMVDGILNLTDGAHFLTEMRRTFGVGGGEHLLRAIAERKRMREFVEITLQKSLIPEDETFVPTHHAAAGSVEDAVKALEGIDIPEAVKKIIEGTAYLVRGYRQRSPDDTNKGFGRFREAIIIALNSAN